MSKLWHIDAYVGQFLDPYVDGTALSTTSPVNTILLLQSTLLRQALSNFTSDPTPFQFLQTILDDTLPFLKALGHIENSGSNCADFVTEFILQPLARLRETGQVLLLPLAIVGKNTQVGYTLVIRKLEGDAFDLTLVTRDASMLAYHPRSVDPLGKKKIRYGCCLTLPEHLTLARLSDAPWWITLMGLFVNASPPNEHTRVEVLYDVLLPLLLHKSQVVMPEAAHEDPRVWKAACVGNTSGWSSVILALKFIMTKARPDISKRQLKDLTFHIRQAWIDQLEATVMNTLVDPIARFRDVTTETCFDSCTLERSGSSKDMNWSEWKKTTSSNVTIILLSELENLTCRRIDAILSKLSTEHAQALSIITIPRTEATANYYHSSGLLSPHWSLVKHGDVEAVLTSMSQNLALDCKSFPQVLMLNAQFQLWTLDGLELLLAESVSKDVPWTTNNATSCRRTLSRQEEQVLRFTLQHWNLSLVRAYDDARLSRETFQRLGEQSQHLTQQLQLVQSRRQSVDPTPQDNVPPVLDQPSNTGLLVEEAMSTFPHFEFLTSFGSEGLVFAGASHAVSKPTLPNLCHAPTGQKVGSFALAYGALIRTRQVIETLLNRSLDSTCSSRSVIQTQVRYLIQNLFGNVLPLQREVWSECPDATEQLACLTHVADFMQLYGRMWQAIERPSRRCEGERVLTVVTILCVFDQVLRVQPHLLKEEGHDDTTLIVSRYLTHHPHVCLNVRVCRYERSLADVLANVEIVDPRWCTTRDEVLAYFTRQRVSYRDAEEENINPNPKKRNFTGISSSNPQNNPSSTMLFPWHMPEDQVEMKRWDATSVFVTQLLEDLGWPLLPVSSDDNGGAPPPTEMEALMDWMFSPESKLMTQHRDVALLRDVTLMYKYLMTMETKEVCLI